MILYDFVRKSIHQPYQPGCCSPEPLCYLATEEVCSSFLSKGAKFFFFFEHRYSMAKWKQRAIKGYIASFHAKGKEFLQNPPGTLPELAP